MNINSSEANNLNKHYVTVSLNDNRFNQFQLLMGISMFKIFPQRPLDYSKTLYCARLVQWPGLPDPKGHWELPQGELLKLIGKTGDVEAETMAILTSQAIDFEEYTEDVSQVVSSQVREGLSTCCYRNFSQTRFIYL